MTRRLLAITALVFTLGVGLAPAAQAQYVPGQCGFTITPSTATPGSTITFAGTGGTPGETLQFRINATIIGTGTVNPDGTFSVTGTVPSNVSPGQYTVTVSCNGVDISNILTVVSESAGVIPGTSGTSGTFGTAGTYGTLPQTGSNAMLLLRVALALVAVGGLIVLGTRRRHALV